MTYRDVLLMYLVLYLAIFPFLGVALFEVAYSAPIVNSDSNI